MKKIICLLTAFILVTGFCGCGKNTAGNSGADTFSVGTYEGAEKSFDVTVYGMCGAGSEGTTTELEFCACQSDTTWTYEWKKVG